MIRHISFCFQWITIGFISSYDLYLALKYRHYMYEGELNPIARQVMELDGWDLSVFSGVKMAGTIFALGVLAVCYNINPARARLMTFCLFLFQILLLIYLHC